MAEMMVTRWQHFAEGLETLGYLSAEVSGEGFPDDWRAASGRVGLLLGVVPAGVPRSFDTEDGPVRVVAISPFYSPMGAKSGAAAHSCVRETYAVAHVSTNKAPERDASLLNSRLQGKAEQRRAGVEHTGAQPA